MKVQATASYAFAPQFRLGPEVSVKERVSFGWVLLLDLALWMVIGGAAFIALT